jgi:hypothetical protein
MCVVVHVPEGIYHVVSFSITQTCGVKDSSHFVKIRLLEQDYNQVEAMLRKRARSSV